MTEFRVIICGSRDGFDNEPIRLMLETLQASFGDDLVLIHGAAKGVDMQAHVIARRLGIKVRRFPAKWGEHNDEWCPGHWCRAHATCKGAGPRRNHEMLGQHPDLVVGFKRNYDHTEKKGGTEDMCSRARAGGVRVVVIDGSPT